MSLFRKVITFIILFPIYAQADESCQLSLKGRILDADTRLPLANTSIHLKEKNQSLKSNGHGFFNFDKLCSGTYMVKVTAIGFEEKELQITATKHNYTHTIFLEHEGIILHDVEVVGHLSGLKTTATSNILDKDRLVESKGSIIAEILQEIPGVTMIQTGATIAKPVIHGMHSNRILMVNNGIKQEGQQWGAEHAPEIDPFIASKITVIKGAESVRYGAEAIGGVILVDPAPLPVSSELSGSIDLVGASNGKTGTGSIMLEGAFNKIPGLAWRAQSTFKRGGNLKTADYYLNNTAVKESNYSAALAYRTSSMNFDVYYSRFNTDLGIFGGAHVGSLEDLEAAIAAGRPFNKGEFTYTINVPRQSVIHDLVKVKFHKDLKHGGQIDLQYGFQRNAREEYDIRRGDRSDIPALDLVLHSHSLDLSYDKINARSLRTVFGVHANAVTNNSIPGTQATPLIPNYDSFGLGTFIIKRLVRENYELEAGARYDYKTLDAAGYRNKELYGGKHDFHNISGSLGAVWHPNATWNLRTNIGLSWRPPTVNELYSDGLHHGSASIEIGDEALNSEKGYKWMNTFRHEQGNFEVEVNAYAHYLSNYIYLNPTGAVQESLRGAFPIFKYTQTDALFLGADLLISYRLPVGIEYLVKSSLLRAKDLNNNPNLPMIPSNRVSNQVRYDLPIASHIFTDSYVQTQYTTTFKQIHYNSESDFATPPPTYSLLNVSGGTQLKLNTKSIGINIAANNLLNSSYKEYMNRFRYYAHDIGRNITIRLSYNF